MKGLSPQSPRLIDDLDRLICSYRDLAEASDGFERRQIREMIVDLTLTICNKALGASESLACCDKVRGALNLDASEAAAITGERVRALCELGDLAAADKEIKALPRGETLPRGVFLVFFRKLCERGLLDQADEWSGKPAANAWPRLEYETLLSLAEARIEAGEHGIALDVLKRARSLAQAERDFGRIQLALGVSARRQGDLRSARGHLLRAREHFEKRVRAAVVGGVQIRFSGESRPKEGVEHAPYLQRTLIELGLLACVRGDFSEGRDFLLTACADCMASGDQASALDAALALAELDERRGHMSEACVYAAQAVELAKNLKDARFGRCCGVAARAHASIGADDLAAEFAGQEADFERRREASSNRTLLGEERD